MRSSDFASGTTLLQHCLLGRGRWSNIRRVFRFLVVVVCAIAVSSDADATTISSGSVVLFTDDFESDSPVSSSPFSDASGDYDPTAGWSTFESDGASEVQVTNSTIAPDPGAFQGVNYLRLHRTAGDNYSYATIAPQTTGVLHTEWMMYIATTVGFDASVIFANGVPSNLSGGGANPPAARVTVNTGGFVVQDERTGALTTVSYIPGRWQKWEVNLDFATQSGTVGVDLATNPSNQAPISFTGGLVDTIVFRNANNNAQAYIDGVIPEPTAATLLGVCFTTSLVLVRNRRL